MAEEKEPKSKDHYGIPVLRRTVQALAADSGATIGEVQEHLAGLFELRRDNALLLAVKAELTKMVQARAIPPGPPAALEQLMGFHQPVVALGEKPEGA